jgi:hypothetical protein
MDNVETPWPPRVGDHIQFVATGASGQVMEITASGDNRQFVIGVYSQDLGKVTTAPHRSLRLKDLAPGSAAPVAPPAARRRARHVAPE